MLKSLIISLALITSAVSAEKAKTTTSLKKEISRMPAANGYTTIAHCILGDAWNGIDIQKGKKYYRVEISNMVDSDEGGLSYIRYYLPINDERAEGLGELKEGTYIFESLGRRGASWENRSSRDGSITFGGAITKSLLFSIKNGDRASLVSFQGEVVSCSIKAE